MATISEKADINTTALPETSGERHDFRVISRPYAGRIGGNQQFALRPDTLEKQAILERIPDAAPYLTWRESFDLNLFLEVELWKQALVECYATCVFVYLNGWVEIMNGTITNGTPLENLVVNLIGEGELVLSIALLVYATAPQSGGHLNPMISLATFLTQLSTFARALLYIIFQVIGATIGAFLIRASYGDTLPDKVFGGCYIDPSQVTGAQAYVFETMGSVALLYLLFGIGIDPHQKHCYGPAYSVVLVALSFGLVSFISWPVKPGYSGVSLNPARCFGLMAASERWDFHYILWFGDISAALINAGLHLLVPSGKRS
ncbi:aquaporin-like protein [Rhizodiscina lignyota]|uniref:Aquaporin-like protein n=1 Tax=Rhizodiscina lignyota TaxID=1504668 RepID=A0A9P4IST5_9PEZI|nr:aquaporin-like protein [Rhizodiscina lignyota]